MRFIKIDDQSFREFADKNPYKTFLQTPEIAQIRENNGWTPYYFGVENDGKLIAATMLVAKPTFFGKSTFFAPGGLLVDYENREVLDFFVRNLKKYVKSHNGYVLRIEPYYELIERDRDGKVVEGGFNHQEATQNLKNLGFIKSIPENPEYLFVLDLKNRQKDELFASFKQNTRNLINRTKRNNITVRELTRNELDVFKKITEATSERRHFVDKTLNYYQTMYDLFADKGEVKYIVAEMDGTILSAAMFVLYGDEVIYLFSGSDEKYMKQYNAQYAIQWYMIQYAIDHKFKKYNFYGIQGLPDPKTSGYGIYLFKKGFGGRVVELIGAYELPVNQLFYHVHRLLSNLKKSKK